MTFKEAQEILFFIKYKKGFRIKISNADYPFLGYTLLTISEDTVETSRKSYLNLDEILPNDFVHRIFNELLNWERHEAGEFFKYKNITVFNPHMDVEILCRLEQEKQLINELIKKTL
jgi:hypothetical protein